MSLLIYAYAVVAVLAVRPLAGHYAWAWAAGEEPDSDAWFACGAAGMVVAAVWPVAIAWALTGRLLPHVGAERRAELEAAERRLRDLERELEVDAR